jgi:hypothetical protein
MVFYGKTRLLKTHSEIRKDKGLAIPSKGQDEAYLIHDENVETERNERVFAPLVVPKSIEEKLPFKSKQKVKAIHNDAEVENRRKTNLLEALNLPTKRPFKKMFMNESDKKIFSMV